MQNVLVSGATGVTGSALVRFLLEKQCRVTVLLRPNSPRKQSLPISNSLLTCVECELKDYPNIAERIPYTPDVFFHLAWEGSRGKEKVNNRDDMELQGANILHDTGAVELCHNLGCPTFLATGSQAEYGILSEAAQEDMPCHPQNGYGAAKLCANTMTRILCEKYAIRWIWARLFSVYGPHDGTESLIDTSITALLRGESPRYTAGIQRWDYLYSFDAANALFLLAQKAPSGIYNVASGQSQPLCEYIETLHKKVNPAIAPRLGDIPYGNKPVMHLEANIQKLQKITGFTPQWAFVDGIQAILETK